MKILEISIEWLSAFFLAVEAIKTSNLLALRDRLTPLKSIRRGMIIDAVRSIGVFAMLLPPIILMAYVIAGWDFTGVVSLLQPISPTSPISSAILGLATAAAWLLATYLMGSALYWVLWSAVSAAIVALSTIERNTHTGVVGITGFVLFSVASVMKLSGAY